MNYNPPGLVERRGGPICEIPGEVPRTSHPIIIGVRVGAPAASRSRIGSEVAPLQGAGPGRSPTSQDLLVEPFAPNAADRVWTVQAPTSPATKGVSSSGAPAAISVEGKRGHRDGLETSACGRVHRRGVVGTLPLFGWAQGSVSVRKPAEQRAHRTSRHPCGEGVGDHHVVVDSGESWAAAGADVRSTGKVRSVLDHPLFRESAPSSLLDELGPPVAQGVVPRVARREGTARGMVSESGEWATTRAVHGLFVDLAGVTHFG